MNVSAKPIVEGLVVVLLGGAIFGMWQLKITAVETAGNLGGQINVLSTKVEALGKTIEERTADPYTSKDAFRDNTELRKLINENRERNLKQDEIIQDLVKFKATQEERERQRDEQRRKVEEKIGAIENDIRDIKISNGHPKEK